ncbi:hypothetical protein scyTo_0004706 [Scyliorhinus torazame]|uniref:Uncharacterized protein n=1 Tax=Scyliorhinus torazame TaxID=75743 RepID=A0A401NVY3_SCYTO|nr:hypothetical protein [Scyliorhinus torazame]
MSTSERGKRCGSFPLRCKTNRSGSSFCVRVGAPTTKSFNPPCWKRRAHRLVEALSVLRNLLTVGRVT